VWAEELPTIPVQTLPDQPAKKGKKTVELAPVSITGKKKSRTAKASAQSSSGLEGASHTQPLSIVSQTKQELLDKGARTLSQAIETVAAASAPVEFQLQAGGAYDLRGFGATVLVDGFSSLGSYGDRDSFVGVERIDFLKGPSSALGSGALGLPPGGLIDIHSAWPGKAEKIDLQTGTSRFNQQLNTLELDSGTLLPYVSVGIAASRQQGNGFFDFSTLNQQRTRPMISVRAWGGRLSVYQERSLRVQKDHPGLPTTGTLQQDRFRIADSISINDPDVPLSSTSVESEGFDLDLPMGDHFALQAAQRKSRSSIDQASQYVMSNSPDTDPTGAVAPTTFNRLGGTYVGNTEERQSRYRVTAKSGDTAYGRGQFWVGYSQNDAPDFVSLKIGAATPLDVVNPTYGNWAGAPILFGEANSRFKIRNRSMGAQWRYEDRLNVFYALTRTVGQVDNDQFAAVDLSDSNATNDALRQVLQGGLLPNTGLFVSRKDRYELTARQLGGALRLWQFEQTGRQDGIWAFYGQGNGHQFRAYFTGDAQPKPELSKQREFGLRWVDKRWGKVETARFTIARRNVPTLDPNSLTGFDSVTTGLQVVKGYDLEASFEPKILAAWLAPFSINASAAWLDGRLVEDNTFPVGNQLVDVPRRRYRVQLVATGPEALPLRTFISQNCQTAVQTDLNNRSQVPARCTHDAGLSATWRGFGLDAVVNNLSNRQYYDPYTYLFFGVIPAQDRNVRLNASYRFSR
jgi:hypothetical protein